MGSEKLLSSLRDEQIEKIKQSDTVDEFLELLEQYGIEIPQEDATKLFAELSLSVTDKNELDEGALDKISGGISPAFPSQKGSVSPSSHL